MNTPHWNSPVLNYFQSISQIPRGSGNEQAISAWLMAWAKNHGLNALRDDALNVVLYKNGTPGSESAPTVMLQAHMDMVCEKIPQSTHNFLTDPITFIVDGDNLTADGTTLGADNGIGIAMILAVLADNTLSHPPLECLITTGEEVGMVGAKALNVPYFQLNSKTLINLDTGISEGVFVVGCAGGGRVATTLPIQWQPLPPTPTFHLTVDGLKGGHSGAEIHLGRGNANQILGRVLSDLSSLITLCALSGGTKENVIPRQAQATIACNNHQALAAACAHWQSILAAELRDTDSAVTLTLSPAGSTDRAYTAQTQIHLLALLALLPCGVQSMDTALGCVATSANLGAISSDEATISFQSSVRSSHPSHLIQLLLPKYEYLAALCGATCETHDFYPGWAFRPQSQVRELALSCYRAVGSVVPRYTTLHGGLECGVLMNALGEMDAISFAPAITSPHSPSETLSISSVSLNYQVLTALLEQLALY